MVKQKRIILKFFTDIWIILKVLILLNKAKMNILTKCWTYVALKNEYEFLFKPGIQLVKDRDSNRRGFNLDLPDAFSRRQHPNSKKERKASDNSAAIAFLSLFGFNKKNNTIKKWRIKKFLI